MKEVVSEFAESANITGGLKVDTITTTGNVNVGGLVFEPNRPSFVAYSENFYTQSTAGENIKYDATLFDTTSSYNTSTFVYTIPVTGIYFFYYSFYWIAGTSAKVRLDKNGGQVDRVILSVITTCGNNFYGFAGGDTAGARSNVILPCVAGDNIRIHLESGSIQTFGFTNSPRNSFGVFLIG